MSSVVVSAAKEMQQLWGVGGGWTGLLVRGPREASLRR